jgi:hypothetical protein
MTPSAGSPSAQSAPPRLSRTQTLQMRFWARFHATLDDMGGTTVKRRRNPQRAASIHYAIGAAGFYLAARMNAKSRTVSITLTTSGTRAPTIFDRLREQRATIERELGWPLTWSVADARGICRCGVVLDDVDPTDETDWPRQHTWLARHLIDMHRVFADHTRRL